MSDAILYESNEVSFSTYGLGPLSEATKVHVTEERNGIFTLEMVYPTNGPHFKELKNNRIIKAHAGHNLRNQRFRISKVGKEFRQNGQRYVTVFAFHVSQLAEDLAMKPIVHILTLNCQEALTVWKGAILDSNPFMVSSDITTIASTNWHIKDVQNPRQALGGVRGSILDKYGGEYKFDNYHISLLKQRGKRANTVIAYGRNLTDLQQEESIMNTYTSVYPYAIYTENDEEKMITVDGYILDSEHVLKYPNRKVLPLDLSGEFDTENNKPTKAKVKKLAEEYIKNNNVGVPSVSMKIEYIDLTQVLDYKDTAVLEEINLCDELPVYFELFDINTSAKVIRIVWDQLMDRYESVELGHSKPTFSQIVNNIEKQVNQVQTTINEVQIAANGKNMVFRGPDTPTAQSVGDSWYKPNGDDVELYIWDGVTWEFIMSTKPDPKIQEAIDEAKEEAKQAKEDADTAMSKADESNAKAIQAVSEAGFAKDQANQAQILANSVNNQLPAIKADAKAALDAYENMEIGSRNLLLNTSDFSGGVIGPSIEILPPNETYNGNKILRMPKGATGGTASYIDMYSPRTTVNVSAAGQYTLSIYARAENANQIATFHFYSPNTTTRAVTSQGNSSAGVDGGITLRLSTSWQYYWITWTQTETNTGTKAVIIGRIQKAGAGYVDFNSPMLVKGNKAMQWDKSPEDVQVQITNINGELSQKVSQTQFNLLQGTVASQGTQITQNKNDIALKSNQSEVNTLTGRVTAAEGALIVQSGKIEGLITKTDGQTTQLTQLQLTTDGLSSTVANIQVGGENLLSATDTFTGGVIGPSIEILPPNETYNGNRILRMPEGATGGSSPYIDMYSPRTSVIPSAAGEYTLSFYARASVNNRVATFHFYSPNTTTKAVTSQGNTSTAVDGGITLRLTPIWALYWITWTQTETNTGTKVVLIGRIQKSGGGYIDLNSPMFVKGNKAMSWSRSSSELATKTEFSKLEQTVAGIQTTVANKADQTQVTQLANQWTQTTNLANEHTGQIANLGNQITLEVNTLTNNKADKTQLTLLQDQINLKVQKGDTISQINLEAGKTLIQTNSLILSAATVTFTGSAFIPAASIVNLNAEKITTGTLNAANVKIINMDASSITSGYLNANRIAAGSITADKLAANAIMVGINSIGNTIKISPTSLNFYTNGVLAAAISDYGIDFWEGNLKIGGIGEAHIESSPGIRGISNQLEYSGSYISWGYKLTSTASSYTMLMYMDPRGKLSEYPGMHVDQTIYLNRELGIKNAFQTLKFTTSYLNSVYHPALLGESRQSGMFFGDRELYLVQNNTYTKMSDIARVVRKLADIGAVQIPTSIRTTDGTVATWKNINFST
ncbi:phage tail protein [Vagococcus sp. BWB3-3]|uniref:Phage tail protein n=1 Tax=Vagococcus allomyrinae TaxID=2794353 RepID=A0A940SUS9_9ENTE|nr:phage tail spike protein [Vagococcus allomyrinae]MBP1040361.1 phage tail protein [Vagococcus allomyrinae]